MRSISSAAVQADGVSGFTAPDTEPSPRPRLILGAEERSQQDGACQSAMMSESSRPSGMSKTSARIDLFSCADRPHAKSTAPQTIALEGSTKTTSSLKPSASLPSLDLVGSLLRTAIASELAAMTGSRMKWKKSASPAGRSWWVLPMPRRPIGAQGSGSWLLTPTETGNLAAASMEKWPGGWGNFMPTARANKGGLPDSHGSVDAFIPTPAAQTGSKKGAPELGGGGSGARKAAEKFLPTVTRSDYGSNMGGASGRVGQKRQSLSSLAASLGLSGRAFLASTYENMMGFPPGWLSSVAQRMAMQSDQ